MNTQNLIEAIKREAESCQKAFTEPHQNPEYRTPFHAMQIMLESLAAKVKGAEEDQAILDKVEARRIEFRTDLAYAASLRDQFAMAALTGLISKGIGTVNGTTTEMAYSIADEMMERRNEK